MVCGVTRPPRTSPADPRIRPRTSSHHQRQVIIIAPSLLILCFYNIRSVCFLILFNHIINLIGSSTAHSTPCAQAIFYLTFPKPTSATPLVIVASPKKLLRIVSIFSVFCPPAFLLRHSHSIHHFSINMAWRCTGSSNEGLIHNMWRSGLITDTRVKEAFLKVLSKDGVTLLG